MTTAFIALGSNLQSPQQQVLNAFEALKQLPKTTLVRHSSLYKTAPVGYDNQPDFINAVAEINTDLTPHALLEAILAVEQTFGRERPFPNAPRVLDLDLLLYDNDSINTETLTVPHPRMHERAFVMLPLAEIAPDILIGTYGKAADLAAQLSLKNQGIVKL
ncbi:MAG TPA: 2-amino-4-hydroxy-6-hydroxymethyldihydropteridine diphosphokinase [Methylophilaceae bacterium]|jgi:2-amino-4-hydroxy-6-hydroxymethyldihydropteridine diphosphokinase